MSLHVYDPSKQKRRTFRFLEASKDGSSWETRCVSRCMADMGFSSMEVSDSRANEFFTFEKKRTFSSCALATESMGCRYEKFDSMSFRNFWEFCTSDFGNLDGLSELKGKFVESTRITDVLQSHDYAFARFERCSVVDLVNTMNYYKEAYSEKNIRSDNVFKRMMSLLRDDLKRDLKEVEPFYVLPISLESAILAIHPLLLDVIKTTSNAFLTGYKGCLAQSIVARGIKFNLLPSYLPIVVPRYYRLQEKERICNRVNSFSKFWSLFHWLSKLLDSNNAINKCFLAKPIFANRENSDDMEKRAVEDPSNHYRCLFLYMESLNSSHQNVFESVYNWFHPPEDPNGNIASSSSSETPSEETADTMEEDADFARTKKNKKRKRSQEKEDEGDEIRSQPPPKKIKKKHEPSCGRFMDERMKVLFSLVYLDAPHYITLELLDYLVSLFFPSYSGSAYHSASVENKEKMEERGNLLNKNYPKTAAVLKFLKSIQGIQKRQVGSDRHGLKIQQLDKRSYLTLKRVDLNSHRATKNDEDDFVYPYGGTLNPVYKSITEGSRTRNAEYKVFNLFSFSSSFATFIQTEDSKTGSGNGVMSYRDRVDLKKRIEDTMFCIFGKVKKENPKIKNETGEDPEEEEEDYEFSFVKNLSKEEELDRPSSTSFRRWLLETYRDVYETFSGADLVDDSIVVPSPEDPTVFVSLSSFLESYKKDGRPRKHEDEVVSMSGSAMTALLFSLCDNRHDAFAPEEIRSILGGIRLMPEIAERIIPRRRNPGTRENGEKEQSLSFNVIVERYRILSSNGIKDRAAVSKDSLLKNGISQFSVTPGDGFFKGSYFKRERFAFHAEKNKQEAKKQMDYVLSGSSGFSPSMHVWLAAAEMTFLEMRGPISGVVSRGSPGSLNITKNILPGVLNLRNNVLYEMYNSFLINPEEIAVPSENNGEEVSHEGVSTVPINAGDAVNISKNAVPTKLKTGGDGRKSVKSNSVAVDSSKIIWDNQSFMILSMKSRFVKSVLRSRYSSSSSSSSSKKDKKMEKDKTDAYHRTLLEMYIRDLCKRL